MGSLRGRARPHLRVPGASPARGGPEVREPAGTDQRRLHRRRCRLGGGGAGVLQPAHPHRAAPPGAAPVPAAADQPVEPGREPHHAGGHRTGHGRRLPPAHPVRRAGSRRRLRAGHAGRGVGARPQLHPVVGAARVGVPPRLQPAVRGGRRGRGRAHGSVRRRGAGAHPRAQPFHRDHSPVGGARPFCRRRQGGRAAPSRGRASRPVPGRAPAAHARRAVGGGVLAARRGVVVRVHRGVGEDRLPHRPAGRLRPGAGPRRHPHHTLGPRRHRGRAHPHPGRLRRPEGDGHSRCPRLPARELLAAHPGRRHRLSVVALLG